MAGSNPELAERLFSNAERIAQGTWNRGPMLAVIAQALVGTDPERAERLFSYAVEGARSIDSEYLQSSAMADIVDIMVRSSE